VPVEEPSTASIRDRVLATRCETSAYLRNDADSYVACTLPSFTRPSCRATVQARRRVGGDLRSKDIELGHIRDRCLGLRNRTRLATAAALCRLHTHDGVERSDRALATLPTPGRTAGLLARAAGRRIHVSQLFVFVSTFRAGIEPPDPIYALVVGFTNRVHAERK
jgi:hypothetical protein